MVEVECHFYCLIFFATHLSPTRFIRITYVFCIIYAASCCYYGTTGKPVPLTCMHAMKRRLPMLLAALSAAIATPAMAQGDPGKMFMINAVTPGVVSFSGEGTAQFNNSSSTANSLSVGSATQFGVNASASATADYMVDANALLQLGTGAQLQQTIGTSSSAANTMAASEAAATAAKFKINDSETHQNPMGAYQKAEAMVVEATAEAVKARRRRVAEKVVAALAAAGFPPTTGGSIMPCNGGKPFSYSDWVAAAC